MEKSTVSSLLKEKKRLKSDFKICEDEILDKQIQLENKINELDNILHDPPVVYDSEETLELAQESRLKMKQLNKEIKSANYTKINHLSGVFVSQTAKSREELSFSNTSKTANVSKSFSIPNEDFSDDTTPSVARKFLNEVKSTIVTLQRVVKQKMTLDIHNWSSSAHQEIYKIVKDEIFPIVNQVDARVQNFEIQFLKEAAKFVRDFQSLIERLQAQLGDQKGKSKDTPCVSDILDPLLQKLENENLKAQLFDKVSEQKDTNKGTSVNTQFSKQSILGKPPSSSKPKLYSVTPFPKSTVIPKVGKSNALSKPITSNSAPSSRESSVVNNERVIAPGIFRINPFKAYREDVNSNRNGFSPNRVESTTRTRRPQPRNNPKSDKVLFKSKSSCLSNKLEKIEENHRSLQSFNHPDHTSPECNNIKLAIRNEKFEVICVTCKKCLITSNHDDCVLQYVNGMKSRKKNQSANVSKSANQRKHKPRVWKPKKVGSKERLASPTPSTPISCLRWSLTGRMFDLKGKIIATSKFECQHDCSQGDNACTSNPQEPINKSINQKTKKNMETMNATVVEPSVMSWKVYSVICSTNHSNGENQVVSKSSTVTTADASDKRQQQQDSTSSTSTLITTITADGNFDL
ncbi:hypothetical protein Tco_0726229 [Tanacetum coccineum]|uniref:Uncharacterized protein n=1 Tax=Tanacetum coccineum TaxID=301880 RepID=A0ABQ4YF20_9ASTR